MLTRKVTFFSLIKKTYGEAVEKPASNCREILNYLGSLSSAKKKMDLTENKFCRLTKVIDEPVQKVLFKSASNNYRAPLMSRSTGEERDNPKTLDEGETVKTHMVIKYTRQEVFVCLEKSSGTMTMQQFVNYLNSKATLYHKHVGTEKNYLFDFMIIVEDNFLQEVKGLERIIEGELYVNKSILGGEALNYSERTENVKEDLKLIVKAKRSMSIVNMIIDTFNKLNSGKVSTINRIRVRGKDDHANEVLIDSELIAKMQFVNSEINIETGEVNSASIFESMDIIASRL